MCCVDEEIGEYYVVCIFMFCEDGCKVFFGEENWGWVDVCVGEGELVGLRGGMEVVGEVVEEGVEGCWVGGCDGWGGGEEVVEEVYVYGLFVCGDFEIF